jgi:hypothetical protein
MHLLRSFPRKREPETLAPPLLGPRFRGDERERVIARFSNSLRRHSSATRILCGAGYAVTCFAGAPIKGARGTPDPIGPACSDASRHRNIVIVERDSAGLSGVPRAVFEGLLHGHPGGVTIFYPPLVRAGTPALAACGCLPDIREDRGLDRRSWTRVCVHLRPPHSHRRPFRDNDAPGLALLSAPMPSGRSRLRYASRKRPLADRVNCI